MAAVLHSRVPMRQHEGLTSLIDQGIIQEVVRPLMSGKEAQIYLVVSGEELRVAKVYKAAQNRTFRHRAEYTEGRAVRNTRTQRAMSSHSRYGRSQDEATWRSAEVDIIYLLRSAGVRVPEPYHFIDGVLVMELITDANGDPAPRLADVALDRVEASAVFATLLSEVVKMLCAGVVHGDLSDFNVLMSLDGPVLIDFPQAVDPAHNQNARKLLVRDVDNLNQFLVGVVPGQRRLPYGQELWDLYVRGELTPETRLTGRYQPPQRKADTSAVLREIEVAAREAQHRRDALGPVPGRRGRVSKPEPQAATAATGATATTMSVRGAPATVAPATGAVTGGKPDPKSAPSHTRRRRRRRRASGE
jgi:RIO kinase 1